MIRLTRFNHAPLTLNCDLIQHIEETPDTVITLTTGEIVRVRESAEEIVDRVVAYRRRIHIPVECLKTGLAQEDGREQT